MQRFLPPGPWFLKHETSCTCCTPLTRATFIFCLPRTQLAHPPSFPETLPWRPYDEIATKELCGRLALAIFDAGGARPICELLARASSSQGARILALQPGPAIGRVCEKPCALRESLRQGQGARILADPPNRRPRGRRLKTGMSEADGLKLVLEGGVRLALFVIFYALRAGRDDPAISRGGIDPVARTVLDAGGHVAAALLQTAKRSDVPAPIRDRLCEICKEVGEPVLGQLGLRPVARAALVTEAAPATAAMLLARAAEAPAPARPI